MPAAAAPDGDGPTSVLGAGVVAGRGAGTRDDDASVLRDVLAFRRGEGARAVAREFFVSGPPCCQQPAGDSPAAFRLLQTVLGFVTRLPCPTFVDHHPGYLFRGLHFFPVAGAVVGVFVAGIFDVLVTGLGLPAAAAAPLALCASLWITGAFHEDGLADASDGIGGGWSRKQVLKIMQDTRLGTYGGATLCLYLLAKAALLAALGESTWCAGACTGAGPALLAANDEDLPQRREFAED